MWLLISWFVASLVIAVTFGCMARRGKSEHQRTIETEGIHGTPHASALTK